jgi:hypothetical protein
MTRKCSCCKSIEHSACNCTSPLLLNCLAELCQMYNYILTNMTTREMTKYEAIIYTNTELMQYLQNRYRLYTHILPVLVRNLRLNSRLPRYAEACFLILQYIVDRSGRNNVNIRISDGITIIDKEYHMVNRVDGGFESPELAYYKDFILNHDILKTIIHLDMAVYISLEIEHVHMIESDVLENCPICINTIAISKKVTTNCLHSYCNTCFDNMVEYSKNKNDGKLPNCPLCRERITKCYKHTISCN